MILPLYNSYNTFTSNLFKQLDSNTKNYLGNIGRYQTPLLGSGNPNTGKRPSATIKETLGLNPRTFTPESVKERQRIRDAHSDTNFDVVSWAPAAVDFTKNAYQSFTYNRGTDDLLADAGHSNQQINGIGYQYQNNVTGEMSNVRKENINNVFGTAASGAALGSVAGPWGAAIGAVGGALVGGIGSIFRSRKAEDAIEKANYLAANTNRVNQNAAMSQGMQMDFYKQYGNPENQVLYAEGGVDEYNKNNNNKMGLVHSKYGNIFAPINAYTGGGGKEQIVNLEDQVGDTVVSNTGDDKPTHLEEGDAVISNYFGLADAAQEDVDGLKVANAMLSSIEQMIESQKTESSKEMASRVMKPTINKLESKRSMHNENIRGYLNMQVLGHDLGLIPKSKETAPTHASGGIDFKKMSRTNNMMGLLGMGVGLGQFLYGYNSKLKPYYTYAANPYENRILSDMFGMKTNTKPIMDSIDRESAAGRYRTTTAGGLGAGQKYLANVANVRNTQIAKADALAKAQLQDMAYLQEADKMAGSLGAQAAQRMLAARQWDEDMRSKAHAAQLGFEQGGANTILGQAYNMIANNNKLGMYKGMYNLYASELTDEQRKILAKLS